MYNIHNTMSPQAQAQAQGQQSSNRQTDKQKSVMVMEPAHPTTKSPIFHGSGSTGSGSGGSADSDDHDQISTERERRKKMRNMFGTLHSMLPHLHSKADKITIVDEAVSYIKALEKTLENLEKAKEERLKSMSTTTLGDSSSENTYSREAFMADQAAAPNNSAIPINSNPLLIPNYQTSTGFETWFSPNLVLNVSGEEAQFNICSTKNPCLFTNICFVLDKHNIEVLYAHISSRDNQRFYMVQAHANKDSAAFPVEQKFIQAAHEIVPLLF